MFDFLAAKFYDDNKCKTDLFLLLFNVQKKSCDYHLSFMVGWSSDKLKDLMADDDKCPKHTAAFIVGFCIQRLMR